MTETVKRATVKDPELVAMHKVQVVLDGLTPAQALRVLRWNEERIKPALAAQLRSEMAMNVKQHESVLGRGQVAGQPGYAQVPEFG